MNSRFALVLLLLFLSIPALSQIKLKRELGLRAYYGVYNQVLPEKDLYRPLVIAPYYNYYLTKRERRGKFSLYAEPQITLVFLTYTNSSRTQFKYELGINGGFTYSYWFNWFCLYAGLGSGPNYISIVTHKQAHGFIFSDNLFAGAKRELLKNFYLDFHARVRHISNAGLKNPNSGINNIFAGLGLSKFF